MGGRRQRDGIACLLWTLREIKKTMEDGGAAMVK
jgi:hypothetical protein